MPSSHQLELTYRCLTAVDPTSHIQLVYTCNKSSTTVEALMNPSGICELPLQLLLALPMLLWFLMSFVVPLQPLQPLRLLLSLFILLVIQVLFAFLSLA